MPEIIEDAKREVAPEVRRIPEERNEKSWQTDE